jgi:hypothetical protein
MPLFGILLALAGGVVAIRMHRIIRRYQLAQTWPKVSAVITTSTLNVTTDSDGTSYTPFLAYSYSVNGIEYRSTVHSEGLPLQHNPEEANRKLIERLPVGSIVDVAVDPANPASAVLDTGFPEYWLAVRRLSIGLVVAGAMLLLYAALRVNA